MDNNAASSIVTGMLGVLFIGLKLTGHISWSWWWVLSPFWIPAVIVLVFFLLILLIKGWK